MTLNEAMIESWTSSKPMRRLDWEFGIYMFYNQYYSEFCFNVDRKLTLDDVKSTDWILKDYAD